MDSRAFMAHYGRARDQFRTKKFALPGERDDRRDMAAPLQRGRHTARPCAVCSALVMTAVPCDRRHVRTHRSGRGRLVVGPLRGCHQAVYVGCNAGCPVFSVNRRWPFVQGDRPRVRALREWARRQPCPTGLDGYQRRGSAIGCRFRPSNSGVNPSPVENLLRPKPFVAMLYVALGFDPSMGCGS